MYIIDKLNNGIRVGMEQIPYLNSISIGIIVDAGSVDENNNNNGVSHFLEHLLFKGTKNRTAKEIAETIDNIGGELNAFTSKENTCYYIKILDKDLPIAIELLGDMFNNSLFSHEEIEKEKGVIIEEINMYLDSPEDLVYDLLNEGIFQDRSLGYPILGDESSVGKLSREEIIDYFKKMYNPENIIISLAGNFNPREVMKLLNHHFESFNSENKYSKIKPNNKVEFINSINGLNKQTEQFNLSIGMPGVESSSQDIYPLLLLNNIFGGSMSSRLFQNIREDKGLAYSIYSHLSSYNDIGVFSIYAGLSQEQIIQVTQLINREIRNIKENLISKEELILSKQQLKGNYILGMEGTLSRMFKIGQSIALFNRIKSPKEILDEIDKINLTDIERVINKTFKQENLNIAYVGISKEEKTMEEVKEILFN